MTEDKQLICRRMADALKLTNHCDDLKDIIYYSASEEAVILFDGGRKPKIINVAYDNGWALIHDIINAFV